MHIHFDKVPPRCRVEHPKRLREYGPHLRILVGLPGGKRKQLATVKMMVQENAVPPALEKCRQRLSNLCHSQAEVDQLVARIQERLVREVEATLQARAKHRRDIEDGALVIPGAHHLRLPMALGLKPRQSY